MSTSHEPAIHTPTAIKGGRASSTSELQEAGGARQQFVAFALNMSWQLAVVVLVPIIGGVELGKAVGAATAWTVVGLVLALIGSGLVMWRTVRAASRLPVPKLTAVQKRAIQKSYEEENDN